MKKITTIATFEWATEPGKITPSIDFYSNNSVNYCANEAHVVMRALDQHERTNGKLAQAKQIEWVKTFTAIEPKTI